ncbi:ABC-type nitrate/sulfonate/bicarbonate transport system ATPase subunit [Bradyrhizobium diazoefficiens]
MALLDVNGVTLRYKTSSAVVTATERVSFTVDRSDRFVLLGPSGCGKSTLLKAVGGYMSPSEGRMSINGREIHGPGADRMMIFQEFDQLLPWKTVLANVMFPLLTARKLPHKDAEARARGLYRESRPHPRGRCLSAHAVRRHEAARRDRARHGDGA